MPKFENKIKKCPSKYYTKAKILSSCISVLIVEKLEAHFFTAVLSYYWIFPANGK